VRHQHPEYADAPQRLDNIAGNAAAALDLVGASRDVRREIADGGEQPRGPVRKRLPFGDCVKAVACRL
jgi:hypothetical protein